MRGTKKSANLKLNKKKIDNVELKKADLVLDLDGNVKMTAFKGNGKKYTIKFNEIKTGIKNEYVKIVNLENDILSYSKDFFNDIFNKIKDSFIKSTIILFSILSLTACSGIVSNNLPGDNTTLAPYIFNDSFKGLQKLYQGEINFLTNFNNFNSNVYKQKGTAYISVPKKFQEFVTKDGQISLEEVVDFINKNKTDVEKINEIYKVDWTIFQKGALYETVNSSKDSNYGDLGKLLKEGFEKDYGKNYKTYDKKEILDKKIIVASNFIKSPIFNGDLDKSEELLGIIESVIGKIEDEKTITIKDLKTINEKIISHGNLSGDKIFTERGMYGAFILNNLVFLLTESPTSYVDNLLTNGLKFEIGYGDNGYINIMGHIIYSKNAKISYDEKFTSYINTINKDLKSKNIEIITEPNSMVIVENGNIVVPGEIKSMIKFFNNNPNSEIKKLLVNSTLLSEYMVANYSKIDKKGDKVFFTEGVQTLIKGFKKDFSITDEQLENIFKYGTINGDAKSISLYGMKINLENNYNNKFIPDYYEKILMNNPNFTSLIHEVSHKFHLNKINDNINNNSYDFITELNSYSYTSNYKNDPIFKEIFQNIFYKAYKGEIKEAELDYFGYYALSTFNYFEFISELNSAYLSYPGYNKFIKESDPVNSKLFLDLQQKIHDNITNVKL